MKKLMENFDLFELENNELDNNELDQFNNTY